MKQSALVIDVNGGNCCSIKKTMGVIVSPLFLPLVLSDEKYTTVFQPLIFKKEPYLRLHLGFFVGISTPDHDIVSA